jgi:hypothetical protein
LVLIREGSALRPAAKAQRPRQNRRVAELLQKVYARRNEFLDLLLGRYAGSGWASSLLLHALVLLALGLILVAPDRKEPPLILTAATGEDAADAVGHSIGDLEIDAESLVPLHETPSLIASGGSTGDDRPDLSSVFGPPSGQGRGSGTGLGDAIGAAIAGRVEAAGGQRGTLQISLAWDDRNDLDLHVVTPNEERIFYGHRRASAGGELDVDMNVRPETNEPVENVTWLDLSPIDGTYRVQVHFFSQHARQPARSPFTVRLKVGGDVRLLKGVAMPGRLTQVATFEVTDGRGGAITTKLEDFDETQTPAILDGANRAETREKYAKEALDDARGTTDPRLKSGKLRRVMQRFPGTESAAEAQRLLQQLDATNGS